MSGLDPRRELLPKVRCAARSGADARPVNIHQAKRAATRPSGSVCGQRCAVGSTRGKRLCPNWQMGLLPPDLTPRDYTADHCCVCPAGQPVPWRIRTLHKPGHLEDAVLLPRRRTSVSFSGAVSTRRGIICNSPPILCCLEKRFLGAMPHRDLLQVSQSADPPSLLAGPSREVRVDRSA